jgi:hypothetical protein
MPWSRLRSANHLPSCCKKPDLNNCSRKKTGFAFLGVVVCTAALSARRAGHKLAAMADDDKPAHPFPIEGESDRHVDVKAGGQELAHRLRAARVSFRCAQ